MIVIPTLDLYGGKVVRFDPSIHTTQTRTYGEPEHVARRWLDEGATHLNIVDLDAAIETKRDNRALAAAVNRLAFARGAQVIFGGGLREARWIGEMLNGHGISRAVIGSRAIRDAAWMKLVVRLFRERIIVGIDLHRGKVACPALTEGPGLDLLEFARAAGDWPVGGFLYTSGVADGEDSQVDWVAADKLKRESRLPLYFAGGITRIEDVKRFRDMGAHGVVLGAALYHGLFTLQDALAAGGAR